MYLMRLKTAIVEAVQKAFESTYVDPKMQDTKVSMEFPITEQSYPSIWVNYDDQDSLTIAGIDHREFVHEDPTDPHSTVREVTRWLYAGEITLTFVALSSPERDRMFDEFVRVFAFSRVEQAKATSGYEFRGNLEDNDFLVINVTWDELRPHGDAASPGTPWGTSDQVIYEKSVGFDVHGEFVSDSSTGELLRLSRVLVRGINEDDPLDEGFLLGVPREDDVTI